MLADREFDVTDSDFIFQSSPREKNQLTALRVEETRSTANIQI